MPEERGVSAMLLKPIRGFEFLFSMMLFHLGSFMEATPGSYMAKTTCYVVMGVAYTYVFIFAVGIMTLREGDIIRINWIFVTNLLGIPLFIVLGIGIYIMPTTVTTFWGVKAAMVVSFILPVIFLVEIVAVICLTKIRCE